MNYLSLQRPADNATGRVVTVPGRVPCWLSLVLGATLACLLHGCSPNQRAESEEPDKAAASATATDAGDNDVADQSDTDQPDADQHPKAARHRNRLADETSPYLRMHAHNPVDWYPWGEEALARARRENKLIFLSVGYSSCYWCHVMERESFMDDEIAAFLNKHYVCIKVDREERPDVDSIYMNAVQMLTRRGGWPMSLFLTPDAKPFFGGTYFPARDGDRGPGTGFLTIIGRVYQLWRDEPAKVTENAENLTRVVGEQMRGRRPTVLLQLNEELLEQVQKSLADSYDAQYGGFGYDPQQAQRPKFPEPSNLLFLLDRARKTNDQDAQRMLESTLERMAMGGIRDHVGGGFHRYSTDRFWHIPHFEKMLYDNGQLATVYAEAAALTGREDFRRVLREMLEFVLREMKSPEGAFYAAQDAESEQVEGKFYRWDRAEVKQTLGPDDYDLFATVYGLHGEPNFEHEFHVPLLNGTLGSIASDQQTSEAELETKLDPLRQKLLAVRDQRERPLTDTKILTSWNGLMIRGLADAATVLEEDRYLQAASTAAECVLDKLRTPEGRLLRTYSEGQAKLNAYLDDYAFLVDGLIALHRATGEQKWLQAADELTQRQLELFWDDRDGGFFYTSHDHEALIARGKQPTDGAKPAGNSVAADNLVYLGRVLDKPEYLERAEQTVLSCGSILNTYPHATPRLAIAISALLDAKPDAPK